MVKQFALSCVSKGTIIKDRHSSVTLFSKISSRVRAPEPSASSITAAKPAANLWLCYQILLPCCCQMLGAFS